MGNYPQLLELLVEVVNDARVVQLLLLQVLHALSQYRLTSLVCQRLGFRVQGSGFRVSTA